MSLFQLLTGAENLRRPSKRVKNVQSTETILTIQSLKRVAYEIEARTGQPVEGLAAPQIGKRLRIIILRKNNQLIPPGPRMIALHGSTTNEIKEWMQAHAERAEFDKISSVFDPWHVMINPTIVHETGSALSNECSLSLPGSTFRLMRPETIFFKYQKPNGKSSGVLVATGKNAVALEHRIDFLKGIVLPDVAIEAMLGESGEFV